MRIEGTFWSGLIVGMVLAFAIQRPDFRAFLYDFGVHAKTTAIQVYERFSENRGPQPVIVVTPRP